MLNIEINLLINFLFCKAYFKSQNFPFFSILINDLVNSSIMLSILMYADDTTIYFNLEDFPIHNRHIEINRELDKVNTLLKVNKLSLNVEKQNVCFSINATH